MKKQSAFPNITDDMPVDGQPGMSKRFYAACKAMQAMMADKLHPNKNMIKGVVEDAYKIADEIIKQEGEDDI